MKHHRDDVKREHHTQLLRRRLASEFRHDDVSERPVPVGAMFWVDDLRAYRRFRLQVSERVLVDSRPDAEIEGAVDRAVALMRENPGKLVFMDSPAGKITVRVLEEDSDGEA